MNIKIMIFLILPLIFARNVLAGDPVHQDLSECHGKISLPVEPQVDSSTKGVLDPNSIKSRSMYQGVYQSPKGAQFVYQVTCSVYKDKLSKYDLTKNAKAYFEHIVRVQPNKASKIHPFKWLSRFNGYQLLSFTTTNNGVDVHMREGLFTTGGVPSSISVRVITNESYISHLDEEYLNLISTLELTYHPLKVSEALSKK